MIQGLVKKYIEGGQRHPAYDVMVEAAERLAVHADGRVPIKLIRERRPSESDAVLEYRIKIYKEITEPVISKVISALGKIRRSSDWSIKYPQEAPKAIIPSEALKSYCSVNYPEFTSLENWLFQYGLKRMLIDANSVVAVFPDLDVEVRPNEYIRPKVRIFASENVLAFEAYQYAVLRASESLNGMEYYAYYIVTPDQVVKFSSVKGSLTITGEFSLPVAGLPAFRAPGEFKEEKAGVVVNKSRIASMAPCIDEAAREYSDLQASKVQHMFPERYEYVTNECPACNGSGVTKGDMHKACTTCNGTRISKTPSPYGVHLIRAAREAVEAQVPTPPIGFIQKDTKIIELQDASVDKHIYNALSAINMEFLAKTPLSQSGIAKEVDRDELNTFVSTIAEDVVNVLDKAYKLICDQRYGIIITNEEVRYSMLPIINTPTKFDIMSANYLMAEINSMRTSGANPHVVRMLEIDYIRKKFIADPEAATVLENIYELDPLQGQTADEKMSYFAEGVINKIDYIISANVSNFITKAMAEHDNFSELDYLAKRKILEGYAQIIEQDGRDRQVVEQDPSGFRAF